MQIIYPSNDFNSKLIDDDYLEEAEIAKLSGFKIGVLDLNKFKEDNKGMSLIDINEPSIWRGWMLNEKEYNELSKRVNLVIKTEEYLLSHHIINWYQEIIEYTPKSIFCNVEEIINQIDKPYFVKDFVKSNTGKLGSISNNNIEALAIIDEIKKYRGSIEGGVCLREVIEVDKNTEERYFVVNNKIFSNNKNYPNIVNEVVSRLSNRSFYTIDVVKYKNKDEFLVIEIGDAQVSDIKKWDLNNFKNVLLELKNINYSNKNKIKI